MLARALAAYVPLEDSASHWRALRAAATVLRVSDQLFATHGQSMTRLGLYLLRTALYLGAADDGRPHFDIMTAAASTGHDVVRRACGLRRAREFSAVDLQEVAHAVELVLGIESSGIVDSEHALQNCAVQLSTFSPHASTLLVNVLFGTDEVDYVGLAIAPW
ncbi:hypothetical protein A5717_10320 [Mycolicibacterium porcinum]|nr:hypothetical protein A5717_10320 [Mycolicibacterium porcinum]